MVENVSCSIRDGTVTSPALDGESCPLLMNYPEHMPLNNGILLGFGADLASPHASCKHSILQMLRLLYQA